MDDGQLKWWEEDIGECLSLLDLRTYASGVFQDPAVIESVQGHVALCGICQNRVERIKCGALPNAGIAQRLALRTFNRFHLRRILTAGEGNPGTIWSTIPESDGSVQGPMVLVVSVGRRSVDDEVLSVAEVSRDIHQAIDDDVILEREETNLLFCCMIRMSNRFPTSRQFLKSCIGRLTPDSMGTLYRVRDMIFNAHVLATYNRRFAQGDFTVDAVGTTIVRYEGITSGTPLKDAADPRAHFLREAMQKRRYLSRAVKDAMLRREQE